MKKLLVTGSSGLIGSECVLYFDARGWEVHGVDNNMRMNFFGADGDTSWNLGRLQKATKHFTHHSLDIRDRAAMLRLAADTGPDMLVHCAAQPSHDLAASCPFDDFDINMGGTMNLLEAARHGCPEAPFIFMSTNKVYGDAPNRLQMKELTTRWDYARERDYSGVDETMMVDQCMHSIFGADKLAADIMVQEYGRYFGMKTVCFRGGCLTGPAHSPSELHGFLAYLIKCARDGRKYRIYGYKGKQVRDNIHSFDVCSAFEAFYRNPRCGEVYNLGGGRSNSISVMEAIDLAEQTTGKRMDYEYVASNRKGDHICYITDLSKMRSHFPGWGVTRSLRDIFVEISIDLKALETA